MQQDRTGDCTRLDDTFDFNNFIFLTDVFFLAELDDFCLLADLFLVTESDFLLVLFFFVFTFKPD